MIPDTFDVEEAFRRHRVVWSKDAAGVRRLDRDAGRIGLGFERASAVVAAAGGLHGKIAMNVFSGAGNLLRLCSLEGCRLLFGVDRLYGAAAEDSWTYDVEHQFDLWENEVGERPGYRRPIFVQGDVRDFELRPFRNTMDVIFVDPPFGRETRSRLSIEELEAKVAFRRSLEIARTMLKYEGRLVAALPTDWRPKAEAEVAAAFGPNIAWTTIGDTDSVSLCVACQN